MQSVRLIVREHETCRGLGKNAGCKPEEAEQRILL